MGDIVLIKAAEGRSYLEFSYPIPDHSGGSIEFFCVMFQSENLKAYTQVWAYKDAQHLVSIFKDMEANWKGWEGDKQWEAIEGEFRISFSSDKLGHILTKIQLRSVFGSGYYWEVNGGFHFEAGQLPVLAKQISEFFSV